MIDGQGHLQSMIFLFFILSRLITLIQILKFKVMIIFKEKRFHHILMVFGLIILGPMLSSHISYVLGLKSIKVF